jgi:uncharacterized protein (TIGR00730 family)
VSEAHTLPGHGRRKIAVFCGSSAGNSPAYADTARVLGSAMVSRGFELVYGGGSIGLMGVLADAVLSAGGHVTGVIPRTLFIREVGHQGLTECKQVETMHERKQVICDIADAFLTLPGGYGTLDETFEALTWAQLGIHQKPIVLIDVHGFWRPLLAAVDQMCETGFLLEKHRALLNVAASPEEALDILTAWKPPYPVEKWAGRLQR